MFSQSDGFTSTWFVPFTVALLGPTTVPPLLSPSPNSLSGLSTRFGRFLAKLWETQRQPSVKHTPAESHPFAIIQGDWWYIAAVAVTHSLHGEMPKQTTSTHIIVPTSKVPLL